jgi:hypothetical protein
MSRQQTAGQDPFIKVADKSFENVDNFKYSLMMLTDQNCVHDEVKSRLNCWNGCYRAVQNLFVFPSPT